MEGAAAAAAPSSHSGDALGPTSRGVPRGVPGAARPRRASKPPADGCTLSPAPSPAPRRQPHNAFHQEGPVSSPRLVTRRQLCLAHGRRWVPVVDSALARSSGPLLNRLPLPCPRNKS